MNQDGQPQAPAQDAKTLPRTGGRRKPEAELGHGSRRPRCPGRGRAEPLPGLPSLTAARTRIVEHRRTSSIEHRRVRSMRFRMIQNSDPLGQSLAWPSAPALAEPQRPALKPRSRPIPCHNEWVAGTARRQDIARRSKRWQEIAGRQGIAVRHSKA